MINTTADQRNLAVTTARYKAQADEQMQRSLSPVHKRCPNQNDTDHDPNTCSFCYFHHKFGDLDATVAVL